MLTAALAFAVATSGWCAAIEGVVLENGAPVAGTQVVVYGASGRAVAQATSLQNGSYSIRGVAPGSYRLTLNPLHSGILGQTVAAELKPAGLCVDWQTSASAPAVAYARQGGTFGTCAGGAFFVGGLTAGAIAVAGAAVFGPLQGTGGLDNDHKPASPSF